MIFDDNFIRQVLCTCLIDLIIFNLYFSKHAQKTLKFIVVLFFSDFIRKYEKIIKEMTKKYNFKDF